MLLHRYIQLLYDWLGGDKMIFTIDIEDFSLLYRLNKEGVFRNIRDRETTEVLPEDMIFDTYKSAKLYKSRMGKTVVVGDKEVNCNSDEYTLGEPYVTINPYRTENPKQSYFTKEQLNEVLLSGDDNRHNVLVIDFNGFVNLVPLHEADEEMYAVRYESFVAGNGYVGNIWSEFELEDLYESLLQGWCKHLYSYESIFVESTDGTKSEKSINDILEILNK